MSVFDGHGINGHHVSDYVKKILPIQIQQGVIKHYGINKKKSINRVQAKNARYLLPPLAMQKKQLSTDEMNIYSSEVSTNVTESNNLSANWLLRDKTQEIIQEAFEEAQAKLDNN